MVATHTESSNIIVRKGTLDIFVLISGMVDMFQIFITHGRSRLGISIIYQATLKTVMYQKKISIVDFL